MKDFSWTNTVAYHRTEKNHLFRAVTSNISRETLEIISCYKTFLKLPYFLSIKSEVCSFCGNIPTGQAHFTKNGHLTTLVEFLVNDMKLDFLEKKQWEDVPRLSAEVKLFMNSKFRSGYLKRKLKRNQLREVIVEMGKPNEIQTGSQLNSNASSSSTLNIHYDSMSKEALFEMAVEKMTQESLEDIAKLPSFMDLSFFLSPNKEVCYFCTNIPTGTHYNKYGHLKNLADFLVRKMNVDLDRKDQWKNLQYLSHKAKKLMEVVVSVDDSPTVQSVVERNEEILSQLGGGTGEKVQVAGFDTRGQSSRSKVEENKTAISPLMSLPNLIDTPLGAETANTEGLIDKLDMKKTITLKSSLPIGKIANSALHRQFKSLTSIVPQTILEDISENLAFQNLSYFIHTNPNVCWFCEKIPLEGHFAKQKHLKRLVDFLIKDLDVDQNSVDEWTDIEWLSEKARFFMEENGGQPIRDKGDGAQLSKRGDHDSLANEEMRPSSNTRVTEIKEETQVSKGNSIPKDISPGKEQSEIAKEIQDLKYSLYVFAVNTLSKTLLDAISCDAAFQELCFVLSDNKEVCYFCNKSYNKSINLRHLTTGVHLEGLVYFLVKRMNLDVENQNQWKNIFELSNKAKAFLDSANSETAYISLGNERVTQDRTFGKKPLHVHDVIRNLDDSTSTYSPSVAKQRTDESKYILRGRPPRKCEPKIPPVAMISSEYGSTGSDESSVDSTSDKEEDFTQRSVPDNQMPRPDDKNQVVAQPLFSIPTQQPGLKLDVHAQKLMLINPRFGVQPNFHPGIPRYPIYPSRNMSPIHPGFQQVPNAYPNPSMYRMPYMPPNPNMYYIPNAYPVRPMMPSPPVPLAGSSVENHWNWSIPKTPPLQKLDSTSLKEESQRSSRSSSPQLHRPTTKNELVSLESAQQELAKLRIDSSSEKGKLSLALDYLL